MSCLRKIIGPSSDFVPSHCTPTINISHFSRHRLLPRLSQHHVSPPAGQLTHGPPSAELTPLLPTAPPPAPPGRRTAWRRVYESVRHSYHSISNTPGHCNDPEIFGARRLGLKRALPTRSRQLQGSDPVVRITQWDTIEHITDFESAADHVRTRQKFEQMSVPLLKGMGATDIHEQTYLGPPPKSAFEKTGDMTSYATEEGLDGAGIFLDSLNKNIARAAQEQSKTGESTFFPPTVSEHATAPRPNERWRHDGPWLPGMGAEEFSTYLSEQLSRRREEFKKYLVEYAKGRIYTRRSNATQHEGLPMDAAEAEAIASQRSSEWSTFTPTEIDAEIRALRAECAIDPLNSKLVKSLIIPFLRLPPIKLKDTRYSADQRTSGLREKFADDTTPNSTHPSAGLGYLRTNAYLANHPILGPQEKHTPVTARVLQPSRTSTTTEKNARLGVAGFVTNDPNRHTDTFNRHGADQHEHAVKSLQRLDIDTEGGAKIPVQPQFAAVSPDGKIHIKVDRSHGAEVAIARGELTDRPPVRENVDVNPIGDLSSLISESKAEGGLRGPTNAQKEELFDFLKTQGQKKTQVQNEAEPSAEKANAPDWAALLNPGKRK